MLKNNIRSIRFSDEIMDIINQQVGDNFNQKFERLIYNCYMLLPERERQVKQTDQLLKNKRDEFSRLTDQSSNLRRLLSVMDRQLTEAEERMQEIIDDISV